MSIIRVVDPPRSVINIIGSSRHVIILHTFTVKQLAQPARLLLKYTGTEFEDKRYEQGDGELI